MLYRLRTDFQLTIITLFGTLAAISLLPFAVYRFLIGELIIGLIDAALVLGISVAVIYAWRSGNTRRPGLFMVVIDTAGAIATSMIHGEAGRNWMFAALLANFFLVDRRVAAVFSAVALLVLAVHGKSFETTSQMLSFLITAALVSLFAFIFAARTETQRLQLEVLATRDPLTGVDNRRAMERELQMAIETHKRNQTAFGLVMLDLDHFKHVNDKYGHDAGDRVLIAFADLLQKSTRKIDRLFRFGGEEFVLLLPGTEAAGLQIMTAKLLDKIAAELRGPAGPVTSSMGAAMLRPDEDWHHWLTRADAAMYRAKKAGRNRVDIDSVDAV